VAASPRIAAGGPGSEDVVKCSLAPVDAGDYKVPVTAAQLAQLRAIFSTGVCNWGAPGVGEVPRSGEWLSFGDSTPAARPFPLRNIVARSAGGPAVVSGLEQSRGGRLPRVLPATGGDPRWAWVALALVLAALGLRRRRAAEGPSY
jgi:MYXO-CTERM domain-containing protein